MPVDARVDAPSDRRPLFDAFALYVTFLAVQYAAFAIYYHTPHSTASTLAIELAPYAILLVIVLAARAAGHPRFAIGSLRAALARVPRL
jgi:hypothetical protein